MRSLIKLPNEILIAFILAIFLLFAVFPLFAYADSVQIASDQDATGVSAVACTLPVGYDQLAVKITRSGTSATAEIECNLGDGTFVALTGSGLPVTGTSAVRSITSYPCYQVRINVTECTDCEVNAWCSFNLVPEK